MKLNIPKGTVRLDDVYLHKFKHEQIDYMELIKDRFVKDPHYVETKNKRKPKR